LLSTPGRHAARSPSTRHGASKVRATRCPPAQRHGGCFACAPPLRVTAIARRGYWRPRRFADRNGRTAGFGQQNVLVAQGHRGGRGSRLAKRSGATGEAGVALRRARLDGGAVFGICFLERARFRVSTIRSRRRTLDVSLFFRGPRSWRFNSPSTSMLDICARGRPWMPGARAGVTRGSLRRRRPLQPIFVPRTALQSIERTSRLATPVAGAAERQLSS